LKIRNHSYTEEFETLNNQCLDDESRKEKENHQSLHPLRMRRENDEVNDRACAPLLGRSREGVYGLKICQTEDHVRKERLCK
jgi:hypothetical protein